MNENELKLKIKSWWSEINFFEWSLNFLFKKNRISLFFLSLALFAYCAFLWYSYLYNPSWSDEKKKAYIDSRKEESVVFDKRSFNKVVAEISNRKNNFQQSVENIPDIFSLE